GKQQYGGTDTGIGLKYPAGQTDDTFQLIVLNQFCTQLLVRLGGTKQYAIWHDHSGTATKFERAQNMRHKQQLGFFGFDQAEYIRVGIGFIQAAFEWRIGEDDVEEVFFLPGDVLFNGFAQRVLVQNIGAIHPVQGHVHAADAKHGGIEVKAPEHVFVDMVAVRL